MRTKVPSRRRLPSPRTPATDPMRRVKLKDRSRRRVPLAFSVMVTGGRNCRDYHEVSYRLDDALSAFPIKVLYEGGARGVDTFAREWAKRNGIPFVTFDADWDSAAGKGSGAVRNRRMVHARPDLCIAFKGGKGTTDAKKYCVRMGIPVIDVSNPTTTLTKFGGLEKCTSIPFGS